MEITKIDDIKKAIGTNVKWVTYHQIPFGLDGTEEGTLDEVEYLMVKNKDGETCKEYRCKIVVDKNKMNHIIFAKRIFSIDSKSEDLTNIAINDRIAELQKQVASLESQKK